MNSFTIKDLENLSGIKAHTIRIWEQRYNFLKPERTDTNIRYYSSVELKQLLNIALLNKYGFKISHIDKMDQEEINSKILSLNQMEALQERIVNELIQHMVDLDAEKFDAVLSSYIASRGIEKAIMQIIFPYLEKIGILWLTNHINPAQEHLVSNIIRQKLIVGIDSVTSPLQVNKTVLLFLPEGEYHELGLLFIQYMIKSRGIATLYLGCSMPLDDIEFVIKLKKPDYLYTHLTILGHKFDFDKFLNNVAKKLNGVPMIISGPATTSYQKKLHPLIHFKRSLPDVMEFIATF